MTWQRVREWIELGGDHAFPTGDVDRKAVAAELPGYLAGRRVSAHPFRVAGAACLPGAAQVAAWLDRRELREPEDPEADAEHVLDVLRDRPEAWRRDLAHRLVTGLRPNRRGAPPNWRLAASLVIETGVEPPANDAFVAGWLWDVTRVGDHPLLDVMVDRLFAAEGVAAPLSRRGHVVGALADLAAGGRLKRQTLIDGCAARFLTHGQARDVDPFVQLWNRLQPTFDEMPVLDLARALPIAAGPLARLAAGELRRYDDAVGLSPDLFAETVGALAFRPERAHVTTAVRWIAAATPDRADGALAALALVFGQEDHALRARAVRLARKLAPHATPAAVDPIREAASALPWELRTQIAAAFGEVAAPPPADLPVAGPLEITFSLPEMPPPIVSADELIAALDAEPSFRMVDVERTLAALVELTHRDRAATAEALRPWWAENCQGYGPKLFNSASSWTTGNPYFLLRHCVSAIVSPEQSAEASRENAEYLRQSGAHHPPLDRMFPDRVREVIALLESGRTIPVLLATPTEATGHVDAATLTSRRELLGEHEPLPLDHAQALLRLHDGGLPEPIMECGVEAMTRVIGYDTYRRVPAMHVRMRPGRPDLPASIAGVCSLKPGDYWAGLSDDMGWWPFFLPSHREVVAAHVLECFATGVVLTSQAKAEVLTTLVQGEGPVGRATASAIVTALSHKRPAEQVFALDAMKILIARDEFAGADFGWALGELVRAGAVKLARVSPLLKELVFSGGHRETWALLAEAIPTLLPKAGDRAPAGLADLLAVATTAALLADAPAELPGLAETAARTTGNRLTTEARALLDAISRASR
ncbi:hypothetical protein [Herbidospora daliensis]|uniref:hypothetical protein n=1 Tax=Herbidospora daliensis TaxID=295585 RepID=UPI0012F85C19|nr:hypothetical protein [Herbidospora daliensis]